MEWKAFYTDWMATFGQPMPDETLVQWNEYIKTANAAAVKHAINELAERYFALKERDSFTRVPTLYQLRKAVEGITAENRKEQQMPSCVKCDGEGYVAILSGSGKPEDVNYPPDPASNVKHRTIEMISCPLCRGGEYRNRDFRERVAARCRSNRRRNELFGVSE